MNGQSSLAYALSLVEATLLIVIPPDASTRQLVHIFDHPDGDGLYERLTDGSFVKVGGAGMLSGGGTLNQVAKFTPDGSTLGNSQIFDNGVSVGINTILPSTKARLEIVSTTQGVLFPKVTTAQRNLIAPALGDAGLFVYNTSTSLFNYWDGIAWQDIDSNATSEWLLDGNTNAVERYIGTNDNFDFPIVVNGTERFRLRVDGHIGAGEILSNNLTIGYESGFNAAATIDNTFIGLGIAPNITGDGNTVVGSMSMIAATSATRNCVFGNQAAISFTTDFGHIAIGYQSLRDLVGQNNTADGSMNVAIGYQSMANAITANSCTAIGSNSLMNAIDAGNIAVGGEALRELTTGSGMIAVGYGAGQKNTTGTMGTMVGGRAGGDNYGSDNVFIGSQSGRFNNDTGTNLGTLARNQNTFIGSESGKQYTGNSSVVIGWQAALSAFSGDNKFVVDHGDNAVPFILGDFAANEIAFRGTIATAQPSVNGAGKWKLGTVVAGAVALDAANYVEVEIEGVIVKLLKAA